MDSLSGLSLIKVLLALMATSRPRVRFLAHGLLKLLAPGSRVTYAYRIGNRKLKGFLRWKDIDSDLQSATELAWGDCYHLSQIPRPDFIVDGGANIGLFTVAAAIKWPDAPIIAFEPVPSNVEAIRSHLGANHLERHVTVEQAALAGRDGSRRFFVRQANQGSFTDDISSHEAIDVSCRAIAKFLPPNPDITKLIKLDIEGGEVEVLDALFANGGMKKTIIVMELHNTPVTRPWIDELARRIGYRLEFFEIGSLTAHCQLTSLDL
ncbi:MAG: FkbM family methyltransferase [Terracidiphilus sp.]